MQFVIGDIHGEISKLKQLVKNIHDFDFDCQLIFLGDYINKGEDSKAVLDYLIELENTIFLIGNHEYYYLEYIKNKSYKKQLEKYGLTTAFIDFEMNFKEIEEKFYFPYKHFFDNLLPYYETENYFISHAGIDLEYLNYDFNSLSEEKFFLFNRYDFITYNKKIKGKITVFGHTGFTYPYYDGVKIGLDTAAVYSQESPLTAFCLDKSMFINNKGKSFFLKEMKLNSTSWIVRKQPYRLEK